MRQRRGGLLGRQGLLRCAVLPRPAALPLGRLKRRRHGGGGDGVRVHHVGAIAGVGGRKEAVGRRGGCGGGGALVVVGLGVVVVGAELVFIGFHSS